MFQEEISKDEILELPLKKFEGEVVIIDSEKGLNEIVDELKANAYLGFDTETKPNFKKGISNHNSVALLQLSTLDKAYLFRLNMIGLPKALADILADEDIVKIGVAVKEDIKGLRHINDFEPGGFLDLQTYVKAFGIKNSSLKKITAIILNFRISKSQQLSNWESKPLKDKQIRYAATDAWVCLKIYEMLRLMKN